ncbi:MAG TPA: S-adenosylmethionine:tRNA ribosyltransferase-isomerase [Gaiellaceae bacterium]|jgi:S-adenosylmethionine:tRNA ribosyltransferase-isomerase|nr:S-adenosylmethionine:tRNA ribosyltransferase-isomerase [Gaiellaceae bacterium]
MSALEAPVRIEVHEPPEVRGQGRDDVAMLVARRHDLELVHARFRDLPRFLEPGDLLVVNTSATLPASLPADGLELRLSTQVGPDRWLVELRTSARERFRGGREGARIALPEGRSAELLARHAGGRLWLARVAIDEDYLRRHGRPIRYGYVPKAWPLEAYQTVFAREPGSAEMPSAGRPFTAELVTKLVTAGVLVAPLTLHTGVSSPERGEAPYPERYDVPASTASLVNAVHEWGGRVVAVGTTVIRALETVAGPDGTVTGGRGWTSLVVTPERGVRAIDGLLTGWHEPESSHLQMLEAISGPELLRRSYCAAQTRGYLWHEFGDLHLILP